MFIQNLNTSFPLCLQPELRTLLALVLPSRVLSTSKVSRSPFLILSGSMPADCSALTRGPHPVIVYKREYIAIHIPPDRFSKVNAAAHAQLDAKFEQHKAILRDSEKVMYDALEAQGEAVNTLVWTTPTTIAGVLALLELLPAARTHYG